MECGIQQQCDLKRDQRPQGQKVQILLWRFSRGFKIRGRSLRPGGFQNQLHRCRRPKNRIQGFLASLKVCKVIFNFFDKYTSFIDCCTRSAYWKPKTDSWKKNVWRIDGESQVRIWKILKWASLKTEPLCFKHLHFHCRR